MMQKALQRVLGVVRSTASEVLSKLEKLGLVTRGRRTRAGRSVTLTERGRRAIGGAYVPQTRVDDGIEHTFGSADMAWVGRILVLERLCRRLRLAFGDSSPGALYGWIDYDW